MVYLHFSWLLFACEVLGLPSNNKRSLYHQSGPQQQRPLGLGPVDPGDGTSRIVLPIFDSEPLRRKREIERKQEGFQYGTSLLGNTSYFPAGDLGNAMVQKDQEEWYADAEWLKNAVYKDAELAGQALYRVSARESPLSLNLTS